MGDRRFDTLVRPLDDEVPLYGSGQARRRMRRVQILKTTATILAVLLGGGGIFVATQRSATSAVSFDEVIERFHRDESAREKRADVREPKGSSERVLPSDSASREDASDVSTGAARPAEQTVHDELPVEGVYAYRTTGGERISLFGAHHDYPERTFATVRHLGGCGWEARNDVVAEHVDIRTLCNDDRSFLQTRQERQVTFFGKKDGARMDCEPPLNLYTAGDKSGTRTKTVCSDGEGSDVHLTSVFLGTDTLVIGGERIEALHVLDEGTCTGRVEGTSVDELWLHPRTGLTLKWHREVDTIANAFGGAKVHYTEEATFALESLEPRG